MGDEGLAEAEPPSNGRSLHGSANDRVGPVRADDEIGIDVTRLVVMHVLDRDSTGFEIDIGHRLLEVERDILMLGRSLQKKEVEIAPRDRIDGFAGIRTVRMEALDTFRRMDDPAPHWNGHRLHDLFTKPHPSQCLETTAGQCQIDRTASDESAATRIGSSFEDRDAMAILCQQAGQKAARESSRLRSRHVVARS